MERDSISEGKRTIIELKQNSNKQNQYWVIQMLKKHLERLHQKLVLLNTNKASRKFAVICRKYYMSKLLA